MIKANSKYPSKIKYVKHNTTTNGTPVTSFQIGDKMKDSGPAQYDNYTVSVFDDVPLQDGDEVVLASIESISCRLYNGKVYREIVATLTGTDDGFDI